LVIKALDPYWSPTSNSGSGSGKNEYGSTTLLYVPIRYSFLLISNMFYDLSLMHGGGGAVR
jgi:hypothetical protein